MVGYDKAVLPDDLWGPFCNCRNGVRADMDCDDHVSLIPPAVPDRVREIVARPPDQPVMLVHCDQAAT